MSKRILTWLTHTPLLTGIRSRIGRQVTALIEARRGTVTYFTEPDRIPVLELVRNVKQETRLLLHDVEGIQIYDAVRATHKIKGDIAEVGTYRGGSTKIIAEAAQGKRIHTFDTFEGLPEVGTHDAERFHAGQYVALEEAVRAYLAPYPSVQIYRGLFPDSAGPIKKLTFSFVHLDVDLYEGTKEGLTFFYPRLQAGGILISHDYSNAEGVRRAFDEFFADKPETVVMLSGSQCLVTKL